MWCVVQYRRVKALTYHTERVVVARNLVARGIKLPAHADNDNDGRFSLRRFFEAPDQLSDLALYNDPGYVDALLAEVDAGACDVCRDWDLCTNHREGGCAAFSTGMNPGYTEVMIRWFYRTRSRAA